MSAASFNGTDFELLGRTTTESDAADALRSNVDSLIRGLNTLRVSESINSTRKLWQTEVGPGKFFRPEVWRGVDYIHGSAGHWYIYNRGGRWEPQFNIGMYGIPGHGYLRVGLGFNLTTRSRDPERMAGAEQIRALFMAFHSLASGRLRQQLTVLASRRWALMEQDSDSPAAQIQKGPEAIHWVASRRSSALPRWCFLGRALHLSDDSAREILADPRQLRWFIAEEFDMWEPIWRDIWSLA